MIALLIMILAYIGGCLFVRHKEKKKFNNGICPKCGTKLTHFDTASDGSRGYTCKKCNYTTWCSYNVDNIDI